MKKGEIYWANLSPSVGSEMDKIRPVLLVSNNFAVIDFHTNNTIYLKIFLSFYIYFIDICSSLLKKSRNCSFDLFLTQMLLRLFVETGNG